jgi:hypothetical protein
MSHPEAHATAAAAAHEPEAAAGSSAMDTDASTAAAVSSSTVGVKRAAAVSSPPSTIDSSSAEERKDESHPKRPRLHSAGDSSSSSAATSATTALLIPKLTPGTFSSVMDRLCLSVLLSFCSPRERFSRLTVSKAWNTTARLPAVWQGTVWSMNPAAELVQLSDWLQSAIDGLSQVADDDWHCSLLDCKFQRLRFLRLTHPLLEVARADNSDVEEEEEQAAAAAAAGEAADAIAVAEQANSVTKEQKDEHVEEEDEQMEEVNGAATASFSNNHALRSVLARLAESPIEQLLLGQEPLLDEFTCKCLFQGYDETMPSLIVGWSATLKHLDLIFQDDRDKWEPDWLHRAHRAADVLPLLNQLSFPTLHSLSLTVYSLGEDDKELSALIHSFLSLQRVPQLRRLKLDLNDVSQTERCRSTT